MSISIKRKSILGLSIALSMTALAGQLSAETMTSGTFSGASDHVTTGSVTIEKTSEGMVIVLGDDFSLDGAPDPKVVFGANGNYDSNVEVGELQSKTGKQSYKVAASLDINAYDEVYIWCDQFSVPLGVAKINNGQSLSVAKVYKVNKTYGRK